MVRYLPVRERELLEGILVLALFPRPGIQAEGWMARDSSARQYRKPFEGCQTSAEPLVGDPMDRVMALGARLIVVACNTATVLAIAALRERWPALRFVGVEPGVKPAIAASRTRRIAVMATPATSSRGSPSEARNRPRPPS